ncbi:hypothetical protein EV05_0042 [Prochlorococcus sp. MIT 0601]|nr:hypothetical protein EV05_0042 [Prochlorococcus sp. MIT 0601]
MAGQQCLASLPLLALMQLLGKSFLESFKYMECNPFKPLQQLVSTAYRKISSYLFLERF